MQHTMRSALSSSDRAACSSSGRMTASVAGHCMPTPPALGVRASPAVGTSRPTRSAVVAAAAAAAESDLDPTQLGKLAARLQGSDRLALLEQPAGNWQAGPSEQHHPGSKPSTSTAAAVEYHVSHGWRQLPHHMSKEQLWQSIRSQAAADAASEPSLASFLHTSIIMHQTLDNSLAFFLGMKLSSPTLLGMQLTSMFREAYADDPSIVEAAVADLQAVFDRDPACSSQAQCLLYFKGFQAVQCHRVAHWIWRKGRKALAVALQSRISEVFHVDIHPAARLGRGILMDHATGVVIGETAVLGDNVVLLHQVTLGGSGTGSGVRHPNIGNGVLLGAGVVVLGPISIGRGSKVGARSVVTDSMPSHCVAVGVPAKVVRIDERLNPVGDMDMISDFIVDFII